MQQVRYHWSHAQNELNVSIADFKARARYFHQIFIFSPNDSPSKTMKNAFYFI